MFFLFVVLAGGGGSGGGMWRCLLFLFLDYVVLAFCCVCAVEARGRFSFCLFCFFLCLTYLFVLGRLSCIVRFLLFGVLVCFSSSTLKKCRTKRG